MAQSEQILQRLLITLRCTSRYYTARPSPLLDHHRTYSGIAISTRPTTTGFSVTFADGPLEIFIEKAQTSGSEEFEEAKKIASRSSKSPQAKVREQKLGSVSLMQDDAGDDTGELVFSVSKTAVKKKRSQKQIKREEVEGKAVKKLTEQEIEMASRPVQLARLEISEFGIRKPIQEEEERHHIQRDYPDESTIDEAGRHARVQSGKEQTKLQNETKGRISRPPSSYKEPWQVQKVALKTKFAEGWNPRKKLSLDTMEGIRALHAQYPDRYTTPVLAEQFAISPEAIRRILKSKWSSTLEPEKTAELRERWAKRHDQIWDIKSQIGLRPKRKGVKGPEDPDHFEEEWRGRQLLEAHRSA